MNPAELRDRIAALAPAIEAGDDEALAQALALQRGGRHSFKAKPPKAAKRSKKAAKLPDERSGELLPTSANGE